MPTYAYLCESCGNEFDLFQKITDSPLERCPKCDRPVRRKIGAGAGIIFKGSGFYATDYRSSDYASKKKSEAGTPLPAKKSEADAPSPPKKSEKSDSSSGAKPLSSGSSSSGDGGGAAKE
jgi:putative FmdB family regulatory protein